MIETICSVCNETFSKGESETWKKQCYSCWFEGKTAKRSPASYSLFSGANLGYPAKKKKFYRGKNAFAIAKYNDLKRLEEQLEHFKEGKPPFYLHVL